MSTSTLQRLSELSRNAWGAIMCGAAMATVGSSVVASRMIGMQLEPFAATALRHALALPVLALLCRVTGTTWVRPGRGDALILLLQAAAGSVGYTVLLISGTKLTGAVDAGVVAGTLPAMATLFAVLVLGERPGIKALLGIGLATAGVLLLTLGGGSQRPEGNANRSLGIVLVAAAVACEVFFILGQRRLKRAVEPLLMATMMSAGGLLLSLPAATLAWVFGGTNRLVDASGLLPALAAVAWYAWVPTVIGFWLWYAGARRATATQAAVATAWLPLVAVVGAALFLGEALSGFQIGALALVLAGVYFGSMHHRSKEPIKLSSR